VTSQGILGKIECGGRNGEQVVFGNFRKGLKMEKIRRFLRKTMLEETCRLRWKNTMFPEKALRFGPSLGSEKMLELGLFAND